MLVKQAAGARMEADAAVVAHHAAAVAVDPLLQSAQRQLSTVREGISGRRRGELAMHDSAISLRDLYKLGSISHHLVCVKNRDKMSTPWGERG